MVVRLLERVERAGREDGRGVGRATRDFANVASIAASKPGLVDREVLVGGEALGDLDRDAVGRVEVERILAGDDVGAGGLGLAEGVVEELQAVLEVPEELLLFLLDDGLDPRDAVEQARDRAGP